MPNWDFWLQITRGMRGDWKRIDFPLQGLKLCNVKSGDHLEWSLMPKEWYTLFIAELFTIAKTWKQPKCRQALYIYNGILLSHKKEWNNAICSNMDGSRDYHTKWSQSDRERQIPYDITYIWNLKYETGNSPAVQWLGLRTFIAKGAGSIPGWGTKIPQAMGVRPKKKKNDTNELIYKIDSHT